ncbi:T6SS amidase immunity protein Tai4 family protein [Erwinia sp.]|uniref:T6SS amidase immunity protein Tai4 family protein n=1 Tax=Erwinia citreus TaxID=558 RepID=UPI002899AB9F|nr:T6SS amidase immunity protein Tai4 family protein [Erwinia sp.]
MKLLLLLALALSPVVFAITPPNLDAYQQPQILSNWLLSRCAGKISTDKAFTDDAYKSASAWLERSHLPIEAFNDGDRLISDYLKMKLSGADKSNLNMMKCTLLAQSQDAMEIFEKYNK